MSEEAKVAAEEVGGTAAMFGVLDVVLVVVFLVVVLLIVRRFRRKKAEQNTLSVLRTGST